MQTLDAADVFVTNFCVSAGSSLGGIQVLLTALAIYSVLLCGDSTGAQPALQLPGLQAGWGLHSLAGMTLCMRSCLTTTLTLTGTRVASRLECQY